MRMWLNYFLRHLWIFYLSGIAIYYTDSNLMDVLIICIPTCILFGIKDRIEENEK